MYERLSAIEVVFYSSFKVVTYLNAITHNFPQYTMDIVKFWDMLQPFFVVGVVLVGLIAAWRVRCWSNRNTRPDSSRPLNLQYVTIDWKFLSHVVFFFYTHTCLSCFRSRSPSVAIGSFSSNSKTVHSFFYLLIIMEGMRTQ